MLKLRNSEPAAQETLMHLPKFGRFPLASQPHAQIWGEHESALLVTLRVQLRPEESKMIL